jgi:hypothetical protein
VGDLMALGDDVAAALPVLRAEAESLMTDTIRLETLIGTTQDETTLEDVATYSTVYEGPGRWRRPDTQAAESVSGEVEFGTNWVTVQLPIATSAAAARGQRATCVESPTDPANEGAQATIQAVASKTHATMRRLLCEEVS